MITASRTFVRALTVALLGVLLVGPGVAQGQDTAKAEVVSVVDRFFEALASADTVLARSTLLIDGQLASIRETPDGARVGMTTHRDFLTGIGPGEQTLLERIWDPTVMVEGRVAMLWAPYDFYIDGAFSHCGIDVFNLLATDDGWRIAGITYTVERENCPESPLGPPGG